MNKIDQMQSYLQGHPIGRIPYSFWTHCPEFDLDATALAEATYAFYQRLRTDFIKNMPNGLYSVEDWGCTCDFSQVAAGGVARVTVPAVTQPADWSSLTDLDIEKGALGRELTSLNILLQKTNGEVPVLATVFSPLTTAYKLSNGKVLEHMREHPEQVAAALAVIADTTARFALRAIETGCAGIFLATQLATSDYMSPAEHETFGAIYDKLVLQAVAKHAWFNVLHMHGDNILFDSLKHYDVQGFSWHVWETPPSPREFFAQLPDKCMVGGLKRFDITNNNREALVEQIRTVLAAAQGKKVILAPGCVVRHPCDWDTLDYVIQEIRRFALCD